MKISVIIPVYNERPTIGEILKRIRSVNLNTEIIVVDDCSTDSTKEFLSTLKEPDINVIYQAKNTGKGAAIREGIKKTTGDIIIIQDADLEYDPKDYLKLIAPIKDGKADVVYGSRFISSSEHRILYFWHMVGNKLLTLISNMFTNLNLSDMETGYKVFKKSVLDKIRLEENRFGFEPEITAKVAKLKCKIYEVGISYSGRTYEEGKKISWKDGVKTLWHIFKYNLLTK